MAEAKLDEFLREVEVYLKDRSGGAWFDYRRKGIVVHLGVVDPLRRDERKIGELAPRYIYPAISGLRFSEAELNRYARRAGKILDRFHVTKASVAVAVERNRVIVELFQRDAGAHRALRRRIPRAARVIVVSPGEAPKVDWGVEESREDRERARTLAGSIDEDASPPLGSIVFVGLGGTVVLLFVALAYLRRRRPGASPTVEGV